METNASVRNTTAATTTGVYATADRPFRRLSWGAIIAGAVLALVLQLLLSMLGAGIGLSTIDPLRGGDTPSAGALGAGAGLWWVVSGLIAAGIGGWLAGKLSDSAYDGDRAWHGLLAWAVSTLVTAYFLGSAASSLVSGAASTIGGVASTATTAATTAASNSPNVANQAAQAVQGAVQTAREQISPEQAKQTAREVADASAKNASRAMLWGALALSLGSLVASLGGRGARPQHANAHA